MCAQQNSFLFAEGDDDQHNFKALLLVIMLEVGSLVRQQNCLNIVLKLKDVIKTYGWISKCVWKFYVDTKIYTSLSTAADFIIIHYSDFDMERVHLLENNIQIVI